MFYTILPQWPLIKPRFERIARFAPLVGVLIGFSQSFFWLVLKYFDWPNISIALITIAISICITGGLHIDGLMDTADGVGAGPSKRIEAMKDSRVGAIGVQSLVIILILQIAAIIKLDFYAPFAFPIAAFWGRLSQIFAIENYEYIFNKEFSSIHQKYWRGISKEIRPSLIIIFIGIIFFLSSTNLNLSANLLLIYCISSGVTTSVLIPHFINKLLGGHNGDSYGAGLVITETTNLLLLSIIFVPN
ncbi:adenosylcobinamide-GDP ribazoletransferase [Prochlorococcus sp. MIT 0801]|uniref:adenosylcobinamide-GDP ribazoletransferase n=1 Tax=Prochlorococcus sp. MIT 0801 TaxID=1501269 RepID=UPI0004F735EF|nr:adenosylcobinamide-GDP ribazoletransferase [Prochlorococcus sp. MIT 0801]AIQ96456.1 Cobalamin synthase [Prochlorococcus sp. MIT 0801]